MPCWCSFLPISWFCLKIIMQNIVRSIKSYFKYFIYYPISYLFTRREEISLIWRKKCSIMSEWVRWWRIAQICSYNIRYWAWSLGTPKSTAVCMPTAFDLTAAPAWCSRTPGGKALPLGGGQLLRWPPCCRRLPRRPQRPAKACQPLPLVGFI